MKMIPAIQGLPSESSLERPKLRDQGGLAAAGKVAVSIAITAVGYGLTLLYTYAVLGTHDAALIDLLNTSESVLAVLSAGLSFGFVQHASRRIATEKEWQPFYHEAQRLRMACSYAVSMAAVLGYAITSEPLCLLGLAAIPMAVSGDYALYPTGKPVRGAVCTLLRMAFFYLPLIVVVTTFKQVATVGLVTALWSCSFIAASWYANKHLGTQVSMRPGIPPLDTLASVGTLAVAVSCYGLIKPAYFLLIKQGLVLRESVYYFEFFKLYFLIFSVKRIAVQTLYKNIVTERSMAPAVVIVITVAIAVAFFWGWHSLGQYFGLWTGPSFQILIDLTIAAAMIAVFPVSFTRLVASGDRFSPLVAVLVPMLVVAAAAVICSHFNVGVRPLIYMLASIELLIGGVSRAFLIGSRIVMRSA